MLFVRPVQLVLAILSLLGALGGIAKASSLETERDPIAQHFQHLQTNPSLETLVSLNKIAGLCQQTGLLQQADYQSSAKEVAETLLRGVPDCMCPIEYMNFPLREEYYKELLKFFSVFTVPLADLRNISFVPTEERAKEKLSFVCSLYYTIGRKTGGMGAALENIDTTYQLQFPRKTVREFLAPMPYITQVETVMAYGFHKALSYKPIRWGLLGVCMAFGSQAFYRWWTLDSKF